MELSALMVVTQGPIALKLFPRVMKDFHTLSVPTVVVMTTQRIHVLLVAMHARHATGVPLASTSSAVAVLPRAHAFLARVLPASKSVAAVLSQM